MIIIFSFIVLVLDLGSKIIISKLLELNQSVILIKNFLNFTYVRNTGAAWSVLDDKGYLVLIISAIIIIGIIRYVYINKPKVLIEKIAYSFVIGGALGNLVNRVLYGYVIDFIDINLFGYNYPIFNLADIFIVIGIILLMIYTWRCKDGNRGN